MSKFHYLQLKELWITDMREVGGGGDAKTYTTFYFTSTDPKTLDWLASSIEASSFELGHSDSFPSGDKYSVSVSKLSYKESTKIKWWFLTQLGQKGWEPFAIEPPEPEAYDDEAHAKNILAMEMMITSKETIHFRKREE